MKNSIDKQDIEARIADVTYHRIPDTTATICNITMVNGFSVRGESACVDPKNFDEAVGRKIAYDNAFQKLWQLEGYLLAERFWKERRGDDNAYEDEQLAWLGQLRNALLDTLRISDPGQILNKVRGLMRKADIIDAPLDFIARTCHEVNRAYCQTLGDYSQLPWEDAPAWQRESARMGVDLHLMGNFGPEASHEAWMNHKADEGWIYGPIKSITAKTHPCMVPFSSLPREQQVKDYIFRAVVHAFK